MKKVVVVICLVVLSVLVKSGDVCGQEIPSIVYNTEINKNRPLGILKIEDKLIEKVAEIHPRFAVFLAGFRGEGRQLYSYTKINMLAAKITSQDIALWLKPKEESQALIYDFAQKQKDYIKGKQPVIYVSYAEVSKDKKSAQLTLIVSDKSVDDPLNIDFMKLKLSSSVDNGKEFWVITDCFIE